MTDPPTDVAADPPQHLPRADYLDQRKVLHEVFRANTEQHDKAILQLTAGTLVLTITFMQQIAPHPVAMSFPCLGFGWMFLVVSLLTMVWSFVTGQAACLHQIAVLDAEFTRQAEQPQDNPKSELTARLNKISFGTFVVGVAFISLFAWLNVPAVASTKPPAPTSTQGSQAMPKSDPPTPPVPPPPGKMVAPHTPGQGVLPPTSPVKSPVAPVPPPSKK